jgi:hypothetical protein
MAAGCRQLPGSMLLPLRRVRRLWLMPVQVMCGTCGYRLPVLLPVLLRVPAVWRRVLRDSRQDVPVLQMPRSGCLPAP